MIACHLDLDIVFVYDDEDERAPEAYAALVRKLINWLTVKTREGDLFEVYLQSFEDHAERQYHNCNCCRSFIHRFGSLVTIAEDGLSFSTIYDGDTSDWGLGQANWDIRFVFDGNPVSHSTIFRVIIADTITQS